MPKRNIYLNNLPLAEAQKLWHAALEEEGFFADLPELSIPVDQSLGEITSAPVFAKHSSPFYNAAAMDGIAVRFKDTIGAKESTPLILEKSQYKAVNTGNVIPKDFDSVIMIEDVHFLQNDKAEIISATTPWQHVRTIGEDIVSTELVLPEGHTIRPIDLGAMLATGITQVKVRKRPKVMVIPTGSDVVQPGQPLKDGNIIEFNSRILCGFLNEWGAKAERGAIVEDEPEVIKDALLKAVSTNDIVIINAGASAGSKDFTSHCLSEIGKIIVHGVNIKPGKPVILAIVKGKPVIGLPGYPVSAVITQRIFVKNLIRSFLGLDEEQEDIIHATLSRPIPSKLGSEEFIRVKLGRVDQQIMVTPTGRGAGAIMTLVQADGILTIPAESEGIGAGQTVEVELLRNIEEIDSTLVFIGSHDNILDLLANTMHKKRPACRLSSAHVGSMGGIMAIKRGEAHLAGCHLLDEDSNEYNVPFIKKFLKGIPLLLVNLALRQQGLIVAKGNPKGIKTINDLLADDVEFINRQRGAGTRILFDLRLKEAGISPDNISGYDREEYTHMNIASAVASGNADAGLGIMAAARALNLDFIPVAMERYDLILPEKFLRDYKIKVLLDVLQNDSSFKGQIEGLGGYDTSDCGKIIYRQ